MDGKSHLIRVGATVFLLVLAAGCSKSKTSPSSLCDNEGAYLIAFASDRATAGHYDIYLFDVLSSGFRLLKDLNSATATDSSPALSRDGQLIAFVRDPGTAGGTDICIYERLTCSLLSTPGLSTAGNETEPVFTGDTRRLAFVRDTLGHRRIRLINGGSLTFVPLPGLQEPAPYDDWAPAPDSTGNLIAFVSDREGSPHLYLYNRTDQTLDDLPDLRAGDARDLDPTLTPNGLFLCFASDRAGGQGGFDIYLAHLDASPPTATTLPNLNTPGDERHPRIGHAAAYIAYQSQSADPTGWNVHYYARNAGAVISSAALSSDSSDVQPSVRLP